MVRIEIDGGGRVSIREEGQKSLAGSMTICEAEDEKAARMLVLTYCKLSYSDAAVEHLTGRKGAGTESMKRAGYTGYLLSLPDHLPPDDKLAYAQRRFAGQQREI